MAKSIDELQKDMDVLSNKVKDLYISVKQLREETMALIEEYKEKFDL